VERTKKAQEDAFQRDIETLKEKNDKNGEWMNRLRVRRIRLMRLDGGTGDTGEAQIH
jgi:hypothetical protein